MIIEGYNFEGPFTDVSGLRKQSGAYLIVGRNSTTSNWNVVDAGESEDVQTRIQNHDRKPCWQGRGYSTLAVFATYVGEAERMTIEDIMRRRFNPPCGER